METLLLPGMDGTGRLFARFTPRRRVVLRGRSRCSSRRGIRAVLIPLTRGKRILKPITRPWPSRLDRARRNRGAFTSGATGSEVP